MVYCEVDVVMKTVQLQSDNNCNENDGDRK